MSARQAEIYSIDRCLQPFSGVHAGLVCADVCKAKLIFGADKPPLSLWAYSTTQHIWEHGTKFWNRSPPISEPENDGEAFTAACVPRSPSALCRVSCSVSSSRALSLLLGSLARLAGDGSAPGLPLPFHLLGEGFTGGSATVSLSFCSNASASFLASSAAASASWRFFWMARAACLKSSGMPPNRSEIGGGLAWLWRSGLPCEGREAFAAELASLAWAGKGPAPSFALVRECDLHTRFD